MVGLLIIWYNIKDYVLEFIARKEREISLAKARNPQRCSILDEERKRAREIQQLKAEAANATSRARQEQDKTERLLREEEKTLKPGDINNSFKRRSMTSEKRH